MRHWFRNIATTAGGQSLAIVTFCVLLYLLAPPSVYETNDDVYYSLIFAGKLLTGAPDPHVVVINYGLASLFAALYRLAPAIPWYASFQVAAILGAIFFLNYCYCLARGNGQAVIRLAVSLATALPFLVLIQFTKTSLVLAASGCLGLVLLGQAELRSRRLSLLLYATAVAFLLLSFSLRKESFFLGMLLCSVALVGALRQRQRPLTISLGMTTLLIALLALVHTLNYGPAWRESEAINQLVNYYQYRYEDNRDVYAAAGLSENDYHFLMHWGFVDEKVYSRERLDYILARGKRSPVESEFLPALEIAVYFPATNYLLTVAGLVAIALLCRHHPARRLLLTVLLPLLACILILALQGRFPSRVSTAMAFTIPWLVLLQSEASRKRRATMVGATMLVAVLAVPVSGQYRDLQSLAETRREQNRELHQMGRVLATAPATVVTVGGAFPYEGLLPFESPAYLSAVHFVWLCGMNQKPLQKRQLADLQLTDLFEALVTDSRTFLVIDRKTAPYLQQYLFEHYQRRTAYIPLFTGQQLTLYKLTAP